LKHWIIADSLCLVGKMYSNKVYRSISELLKTGRFINIKNLHEFERKRGPISLLFLMKNIVLRKIDEKISLR